MVGTQRPAIVAGLSPPERERLVGCFVGLDVFLGKIHVPTRSIFEKLEKYWDRRLSRDESMTFAEWRKWGVFQCSPGFPDLSRPLGLVSNVTEGWKFST
jgi:hypothetical protein